ncbi:hypothetical protein ALC56_14561 [Trachymyrmex septentrionalis]|uniref:Uncharacterized protein n=1 Tax=Trachymyrmex septentrionalis TaxID=34720 RepID=A0A195ETG7_9HYME|nr:hypothetical protein ALC56_14561 [Trachymyrmex septentrionalis]
MSVRVPTDGTPKPIGENWRDSSIYSATPPPRRPMDLLPLRETHDSKPKIKTDLQKITQGHLQRMQAAGTEERDERERTGMKRT